MGTRIAFAFAFTTTFASNLLVDCASYLNVLSLMKTSYFHQSISDSIDVAKIDGGTDGLHVFRRASSGLSSLQDTIRYEQLLSTDIHELVFIVQEKNIDELERILLDISNPSSPNYGNHLTRQDIINLTSDPVLRKDVTTYLEQAGATVVEGGASGGLVTARGSIDLWSRMLNTQFYSFSSLRSNGDSENSQQLADMRFIRTNRYSVPSCLDKHIVSILNTIETPEVLSRRLPPPPPDFAQNNRLQSLEIVTPQMLAKAYNIDDNIGHPRATQEAFAYAQNYFSPEDLAIYQARLNLPNRPVNESYGSRTSEYCGRTGLCYEGNLDIQLMQGISDTPTIFGWTRLMSLIDYVNNLVYSEKRPPLVISISYGADEEASSADAYDAFNIAAMKLGAMGSTILVASGDDGALSPKARDNGDNCYYKPDWPATSPWIVSVGGTQVSPTSSYISLTC